MSILNTSSSTYLFFINRAILILSLYRSRVGTDAHSSSDEETEEVPELLRRSTDEGSYASSSSLESTTPSTRRKFSQVQKHYQTKINLSLDLCNHFRFQEGDTKVEAERMTMYKCILSNIIDSETNYVEWLGVLIKVKDRLIYNYVYIYTPPFST